MARYKAHIMHKRSCHSFIWTRKRGRQGRSGDRTEMRRILMRNTANSARVFILFAFGFTFFYSTSGSFDNPLSLTRKSTEFSFADLLSDLCVNRGALSGLCYCFIVVSSDNVSMCRSTFCSHLPPSPRRTSFFCTRRG